MDHELILTPGLGNATHLLAADGEAIVVDPPRDAWRVSAHADARGWRLTHVVETHVHNDYLSGALELRASHGVEIVAPARGGYAFAHRGADDGDVLEVAGYRLTARATPGHTPDHLAWDLSADGASGPSAVLTGGSLMVGSAGRTDLLGPEVTDELTRAQFRSLRALAELPPDVVVLPTHGTGSFCAAGPVGGGRTSTIGRERATNELLRIDDEDAFRAAMVAGFGPYPTYYREMAPINRAGPAVLGRLPTVAPLSADGLRAAIDAGAHIVDARSRRDFAAGHIAGALNIELTDTFASYVGWFIPFGAPVVLVLPAPLDDALAEATAQLFRIGYDRIDGVSAGGVSAWAAAGGALERYPLTTIGETRAALAAGGASHLLDVRDPDEWRHEGTVPGAIELSLGDLPARLGSLPRDAPITVMCRSGSRASIAASMLDAAGFDVRLVAAGGAPDWHRR
jgi:glyoxylase-like metal-dependent hydrolase (beta-lactamase superfamily II)/rhodanese-related sulfurtransferase